MMDMVALVPILLLLALAIGTIMPVKGTFNSVTVVSYNELMKTLNGEVMCALDTANETITSSSSLEHCSLRSIHILFAFVCLFVCCCYYFLPSVNIIQREFKNSNEK